jgi:hypothetical protein
LAGGRDTRYRSQINCSAELTDTQRADRHAEAERLRRLFRFFAATQCRGRSLVYETLSEGVAGHDALLNLLMSTPSEQRRPSLLFAAVNLLLAAHPGAPLADYYPIHGGRRPADEQLVAALAAFCAEHGDELARLLRSLNLLFDRYRYRLGDQETASAVASPVLPGSASTGTRMTTSNGCRPVPASRAGRRARGCGRRSRTA